MKVREQKKKKKERKWKEGMDRCARSRFEVGGGWGERQNERQTDVMG